MSLDLQGFTFDELFALMAANAPNPTKDHIQMQQRFDMSRNPHNDGPPKPPLRSEAEIVADYKLEMAETLMKRLAPKLDKLRMRRNG